MNRELELRLKSAVNLVHGHRSQSVSVVFSLEPESSIPAPKGVRKR